MKEVDVPLHAVAHARAGDKGNRSNISIIPYLPEAFPYLLEQVTEARVLAALAHKGATACKRYVLPNLPAMNFVIDDALEGGVNLSLSLDGHGKSLSFLVLGDIKVRVPLHCVPVGHQIEQTQIQSLNAEGAEEKSKNAEKSSERAQ